MHASCLASCSFLIKYSRLLHPMPLLNTHSCPYTKRNLAAAHCFRPAVEKVPRSYQRSLRYSGKRRHLQPAEPVTSMIHGRARPVLVVAIVPPRVRLAVCFSLLPRPLRTSYARLVRYTAPAPPVSGGRPRLALLKPPPLPPPSRPLHSGATRKC